MPRYRTELVAGTRPPYDTWTFAVVPPRVRAALGGAARIEVRGTIAGAAFRATVRRGEGQHRFAVPRAIRQAAGVAAGDLVEITIGVDDQPRDIEVPAELRQVLDAEGLWQLFEQLAPSCRRAWARHVGEARQAATRTRRAGAAPAAIRARRFPGQR